jgi:ureidoglycolate dehydrogenase (NAD+)
MSQVGTSTLPQQGAGQIRIEAEVLTEFVIRALTSFGLREEDATTVADVLVTTDTWGTFSHGTNHLHNYCRKIKAGGIDAKAQPEIVNEGLAWARIDGHGAIGMVPAHFGMKTAVAKARAAGIGFATVSGGGHFGAAGYYANLAAQEGMIGIAMSNSDPNMTVPGGRGHVIGNNPFSYAIPNGDEPPIFLDIALSVVAASKVLSAKKRGESIPADWIVDGDGIATTDTGGYPETGSLQPMGGHKGYGLAFMIEAIAGALSGAALVQEVPSWLFHLASRPNLGHAFIAINVEAMMPASEFAERTKRAAMLIREAPRAKGADRIYLPGEMEWQRRKDALRYGISLPVNVIADLKQLAAEIGTNPDELFEQGAQGKRDGN